MTTLLSLMTEEEVADLLRHARKGVCAMTDMEMSPQDRVSRLLRDHVNRRKATGETIAGALRTLAKRASLPFYRFFHALYSPHHTSRRKAEEILRALEHPGEDRR